MKNILIICLVVIFASCASDFIEDLYVQPVASFSIDKTEYDVLESVNFTNSGQGQKYVVYPGDSLHRYNRVGETGYATASNGKFSYSYQDPGTYTAVWIASSINDKGEVITAIDSVKINVIAKNGGLDKFTIYNIYRMPEYSGTVYYSSYGEFISSDTILCPIIFDAWRDATVNSIKANQLIYFDLASSLASMYWVDESNTEREIKSGISSYRFVKFVRDGKLAIQQFVVKTASGIKNNYYVAPVLIPKMTKFSINGVEGTISRNLAYYNQYDIAITLPSGTDLSAVTPVFETMNNDPNLTDGNNVKVWVGDQLQTSGVSVVNASGKSITYKIQATLLGSDNPALMQEATVKVTITN